MPTISESVICKETEKISQGDVYRNVRYTYIDSESDSDVDIIEYTFPMAIIISQACDVGYMSELIEKQSGRATKFMPSILMCPIYNKDEAKNAYHLKQVFEFFDFCKTEGNDMLFNSDEFKIAKKDWHYRYHSLTVRLNGKTILENGVLDFKHYFTVPASYLLQHRDDRLFRIEDIYAEQLTLKFATYLSRVAIPDL